MKVVQATLRHASITTTSNLYTSVLSEVARAAAERTALIIPGSRRVFSSAAQARLRPLCPGVGGGWTMTAVAANLTDTPR